MILIGVFFGESKIIVWKCVSIILKEMHYECWRKQILYKKRKLFNFLFVDINEQYIDFSFIHRYNYNCLRHVEAELRLDTQVQSAPGQMDWSRTGLIRYSSGHNSNLYSTGRDVLN